MVIVAAGEPSGDDDDGFWARAGAENADAIDSTTRRFRMLICNLLQTRVHQKLFEGAFRIRGFDLDQDCH
jgi:hypothetical protein